VDIAELVMGQRECAVSLFEEFTFDKDCLKLFISKGLGIGIVVGSSIVKVPQVYAIYKADSTAGVNLGTQFLELFSFSSAIAYNYANGFPFSTWGESFFQAIQVVLIIALMQYKNKASTALTLLVTSLYGGVMWAAATGMIPTEFLMYAYQAGIPAVAIGRWMQIYSVVKEKSTGALSIVTSFLNVAGCLARVYTTLQEVDDSIILISFLVGTLNNIAVFTLFFIYPAVKKSGKEKSK